MPSKIIISEGDRFGKLVYLGEDGKHILPCGAGLRRIKVRCDCGRELSMMLSNIRNAGSTTCGCDRDNAAKERMTTHGMVRTKTYKSWAHMKERCGNPNEKRFCDYGGRGITVCERWCKFENFLADMGEIPSGKSIDRIDNDKGYSKGNCKWSDRTEQGRNKRNNIIITYQGNTMVLSEWAEKLGIGYHTLRMRIKKGFPLGDALDVNFGKVLYNGEYSTVKELCDKYKRSRTTFFERRRKGWSMDRILLTKPKTRSS